MKAETTVGSLFTIQLLGKGQIARGCISILLTWPGAGLVSANSSLL